MKINIDIKINSADKIIKDHGLDDDGRVTEHFRDTADRFMDPYIPTTIGSGAHMKDNKSYPDKKSIKYNSIYSHYHYKGKKAIGPSKPKGVKRTISNEDMQYQGAPKRGPEWDKRMIADREQDLINDLQNFINSGG